MGTLTKTKGGALLPGSRLSRLGLISILAVLFALACVSIGHAVPGAETAQEAQEIIAERGDEAMAAAMTEEAERINAEEAASRAAEAAAAMEASGAAPIQSMWIVLFDDVENERTTVSIQGAIDPYTPLPAKVMFYFAEDYELESLTQTDFDTGEDLGDVDYEASPSGLEGFENITTYSFVLTEGHVFSAGFSLPLPLFDFEGQMGDSPLASFNFLPPNDMKGLVVGFVAPSEDRVGAGTDVVFVGETEEGEVYGIVRENVEGGVLQDYTIAFGSRESRDAALAEAEAAALAAEEAANVGPFDWFKTPAGMIITGVVLVLVIAAAVIVVLVLRQRKAVAGDGIASGSDGSDWDDDYRGTATAGDLDEVFAGEEPKADK